MAVLTAKGIAGLSIPLLNRLLVLPRTASLVSGDEYMGPNGGTVTVRVPQPSTSRTQASPGAALTADAMNEIPVDVSLSHEYHLTNITDQDMTYNLEKFAEQVTLPQVRAVAAGAEPDGGHHAGAAVPAHRQRGAADQGADPEHAVAVRGVRGDGVGVSGRASGGVGHHLLARVPTSWTTTSGGEAIGRGTGSV